MKRSLLFIILINAICIYPQNKMELFPRGLNFVPLKATLNEARMGIIYSPENNNMKIDVGDNVDLISFRVSDDERITAGVEFFAYALSRSYNEFRLQIDAVDGLFGGNISYSKKINDKRFSGRIRIIHNSAHLVDGHWDFHNGKWIDDYKPIPYARDYAELALAYEYNTGFALLKNYTSFEYSFLVRPDDVKRFNFNGGIEAGLNHLTGSLLGEEFRTFVAYNFLLSGAGYFSGSNNFMLGIKFGKWNENGVTVFINYYKGLDVFHAYYKERVERAGIGFTIDFL